MRAFLAIGLPEEMRRAATHAARALALPEADWRVVREDGLHITIRFLGDCDPVERSRQDAAWLAAAAGIGSVPVRLRGAAALPGTRRPRVIRLGVDDCGGVGALATLASRIEHAARASGFPPERRPFAPHVTLARARSARARVPLLFHVGVVGEFVATKLTLYRSELGPGGARYHEEASFPLAGAALS